MQRYVDPHPQLLAISRPYKRCFSSEQDRDTLCTSMHGHVIWESTCSHCNQTWNSGSSELGLETALPDDQHRPPEVNSTSVKKVVWSLQQILDFDFGVEAMEEDFRCSLCSQRNSTSRKILCMEEPPEILKVTIKWFSSATQTKKSRKLINYQEVEINVRESQTSPVYPARYGLYAIIFHHGKTLAGGHYTCIGRGSGCVSIGNCEGLCAGNRNVKCSTAGWRLWNDNQVSEPKSLNESITAATQLSRLHNGLVALDSSRGISPYIFFFARIRTEGTFDPSVPQCALCDRGQGWRQSLQPSAAWRDNASRR
jgi:hypothetical protein